MGTLCVSSFILSADCNPCHVAANEPNVINRTAEKTKQTLIRRTTGLKIITDCARNYLVNVTKLNAAGMVWYMGSTDKSGNLAASINDSALNTSNIQDMALTLTSSYRILQNMTKYLAVMISDSTKTQNTGLYTRYTDMKKGTNELLCDIKIGLRGIGSDVTGCGTGDVPVDFKFSNMIIARDYVQLEKFSHMLKRLIKVYQG